MEKLTDDEGEERNAQIDAHLKLVFEKMADEALPDHLVALLDKLRAEDGTDKEGDTGT